MRWEATSESEQVGMQEKGEFLTTFLLYYSLKKLKPFMTKASLYLMLREVKEICKGIFHPNLLGDIMTC